jgi:hypothetical protein
MTTLQISTLNTLTYSEEASAKAFAVAERIASLSGSVLKLVRHAASAGRAQALRVLEPETEGMTFRP